MNSTKNKMILLFWFAVLLTAFMIVSCNTSKPIVNAGSEGIAIKGYDTVAYFTMGKPVKGDEQFTNEWHGAKWLFSSVEHRDLFAANPEKYAPQYGGYWAYAVSRGSTADIDPQLWTIEDGKLYLNLNDKVSKLWFESLSENIKEADKNWPSVLNK